ncbi:hypothetical protein PSCLAVI8L_50058 [Pseudoclavibacter sp. 8L]|nr:hypothetical protein PSCLAVI8L_50058 [Pseudoclavibacter sp. 8L]
MRVRAGTPRGPVVGRRSSSCGARSRRGPALDAPRSSPPRPSGRRRRAHPRARRRPCGCRTPSSSRCRGGELRRRAARGRHQLDPRPRRCPPPTATSGRRGRRVTPSGTGGPARARLGRRRNQGRGSRRCAWPTVPRGVRFAFANSLTRPEMCAAALFLPGAFLPGAFLCSALLPGAFLPGALLCSALLPGAFLPGALLCSVVAHSSVRAWLTPVFARGPAERWGRSAPSPSACRRRGRSR